ncbi:hypothetical protein PLICRDRAFT_53842 [Plicaturopsis crispa FD-325 SS-3]|nr:hypothetical protein PLICRDRAFT_53842 [Plicaturopsis crispa FD-325 SS-3]
MSQRLALTTTSLHNVVISNASDDIYYEVVTPKWAPETTKISRLAPETREFLVVGELQNKDGRPVAVRVYGGVAVPAGEFLRSEGQKQKRFRGRDGKDYLWRHKNGRLELTSLDAPGGSRSVATYRRHRRHLFMFTISRQPYIEVDPSVLAVETLDILILSFLLTERERRDRYK